MFMLLTKKLITKIKTFLTDSQPGQYVSKNVGLSQPEPFFIKKVLIRKSV